MSSKEGVTGEAEQGAVSSELGSLDGGASTLSDALGDRADHIAHLVAFNEAEATALAEATGGFDESYHMYYAYMRIFWKMLYFW